MKKILITGSKGNIGLHLVKNLSKDYNLTLFDLPRFDVRRYGQLIRVLPGHEAVIHLAWNTKTENFQSKKIDFDNILMFSNVYRAALEAKVPKVIMASSIHADNFQEFLQKNKKGFMNPYKIPSPMNVYGKDKVAMENLGKEYARKGLEVVCIRIGAIGPRKDKPTKKEGMAIWLTHEDFAALIRKIIETKKIPNNYSIVYGVSNNKTRINDYSNPFGWKPKDDSSDK